MRWSIIVLVLVFSTACSASETKDSGRELVEKTGGAKPTWLERGTFPDPGRAGHRCFTGYSTGENDRGAAVEAADAVEKKDLKQAAVLFGKISAKQKDLTPFYREKTLEWLRTIQEELFLENYSRMITAQKNGDMITAARYFETTEKLAPPSYAWTMKNLKPQFEAYIDTRPPVLNLTSPRGGSAMAPSAFFTIRGEVIDDKAVHRVTVNGMEVLLAGDDEKKQNFAHKVELAKGKNLFDVEAFDRRGHSVKARAEVIFKKETVAKGFIFIKELVFTTGGVKHRVKIYRHQMTALEFVLVPGGKFTMGAPPEEAGREADEGPQHEVTIEPFLLCRTEVPQAMWQRSMMTAPWRGKREVDDNPLHPATYLSWEDCLAFCSKTGLRMPTEAEWEYACRAGTATRFCFGNKDSKLQDYAWFQGNTTKKGKGTPQRIGNRKPNAFGLYDMHGNVWEWCADTWHGNYEGAPADGSAWLDPPSEFRVLRSGSFSHTPARCRSAYRVRIKSEVKNSSIGFRPAFTLPQPKK